MILVILTVGGEFCKVAARVRSLAESAQWGKVVLEMVPAQNAMIKAEIEAVLRTRKEVRQSYVIVSLSLNVQSYFIVDCHCPSTFSLQDAIKQIAQRAQQPHQPQPQQSPVQVVVSSEGQGHPQHAHRRVASASTGAIGYLAPLFAD